MTEDILSPICASCGKRGKMPSYDTGHALWSSLPDGWLVGLKSHSLIFVCSETCAQETDDLNIRAAEVSAPILKRLASG